MHRQPSRIVGLLSVPSQAATDWDRLATEYRARHPQRLPDLMSPRRGWTNESPQISYRRLANHRQLVLELNEALDQFFI